MWNCDITLPFGSLPGAKDHPTRSLRDRWTHTWTRLTMGNFFWTCVGLQKKKIWSHSRVVKRKTQVDYHCPLSTGSTQQQKEKNERKNDGEPRNTWDAKKDLLKETETKHPTESESSLQFEWHWSVGAVSTEVQGESKGNSIALSLAQNVLLQTDRNVSCTVIIAEYTGFRLHTFPIDGDDNRHACSLFIRLFEFERGKNICSVNASTMYSVQSGSCANLGKTPEIGESPPNQPISGLFYFSKYQALSRALVVYSKL